MQWESILNTEMLINEPGNISAIALGYGLDGRGFESR